MAEVKTRICDVCSTSYKVRTYRVDVVRECQPEDLDIESETSQYCDLCPKHLKRLYHFIDRGTTPPAARANLAALENEETEAT